MIATSFTFIIDLLNIYLKKSFGVDEDYVILNNLNNSDGSFVISNSNKVVLTLIAIEKENSNRINFNKSNERQFIVKPIDNYNYTILISFNFNDYFENLKFLNSIILFFEENTIFNGINSLSLPRDIEKLIIEYKNVSLDDSYKIWTTLGAKYQPSLVYKIREIKQ
jgi:hypothetical protein